MKIDNKVQHIIYLLKDVKESGDHRDIKEFLKGYLKGLNWFTNYPGGDYLNTLINDLVDQAADQNNIYCFNYQLRQLINDRFDYWLNDLEGKTTEKEEIRKRIDHLHFIDELEDREETVNKIYNIINK